jgi:hypothetical protein
MTTRTPLDRATVALGVASMASALFACVEGDLEFVTMGGGGVAVALGLGVLAVVAGLLGSRPFGLAAGAALLVAAAALLALLAATGTGGFLGGSASTFALWLGLGTGLVVVALNDRR